MGCGGGGGCSTTLPDADAEADGTSSLKSLREGRRRPSTFSVASAVAPDNVDKAPALTKASASDSEPSALVQSMSTGATTFNGTSARCRRRRLLLLASPCLVRCAPSSDWKHECMCSK